MESTFFAEGQFDHLADGLTAEDVTYERLDSEAGRPGTFAAGRESEFGIIHVPADANESTFFLAPPAQSSPVRSPPQSDGPAISGDEPTGGADGDGAPAEGDSDVELEVETATAGAVAPRGRRKKRGLKISRHGIQYPSLPAGVVKRLAQSLAQTGGVGKANISPGTMSAMMLASDWFFEQLGDDLQAYATHAGRKTIDESDMLTLMKRQRQTNASTTPFSLAQRHLPRELLQELRMTPPEPARKRRRTRSGGEGDSP